MKYKALPSPKPLKIEQVYATLDYKDQTLPSQ